MSKAIIVDMEEVRATVNGARRQFRNMAAWAVKQKRCAAEYNKNGYPEGFYQGLFAAYMDALRAERHTLRRLGLHA